jgi:hypothetical protein
VDVVGGFSSSANLTGVGLVGIFLGGYLYYFYCYYCFFGLLYICLVVLKILQHPFFLQFF